MATELEAVNILLVAKLVTPIIDLDSGHPDVQVARALLKRHKRTVCALKWFFNTEVDVDLSIDNAGYIAVPAGVISLDNDDNYIIMQGKLYSMEDRTNVFTEGVEELTLIYNRDWEDLPIQAYDYICSLAKEEFVRKLESKLISVQAEKDINRDKAILDIVDLRFKDVGKQSANPLMLKWRGQMLTR